MVRPYRDPFERSQALARLARRGGPVGRVSRFVGEDLWSVDRDGLSGAMRAFYRGCRVLFLTAIGFLNDRCALRASSLAYVSVLSLVPILALSFSVLKGLGFYEDLVEQRIRPFLSEQFAAKAPELYQAIEKVLGFVQNTDAKAMGWVGLLVLLYTLVRVLGAIEATFNEIFGAQRSRTLVRKLSDYLTIVVIAPIFLGVSLAAATLAQSSTVVRMLHEDLGLATLVQLLFRAVPLVMAWLAFTVFYLVIPNARVRWRSALLGGFMAGSLWMLVLWAHVSFQVGIARYNPIYSSFAALPIFLVWVQISWVVVLIGAELASSHQFEPRVTRLARQRLDAQALREQAGLRAAVAVTLHFQVGAQPLTTGQLASRIGVEASSMEAVLEALAQHGILFSSQSEGDSVWVPGREPKGVRIVDVQEALRSDGQGSAESQALPAGSPGDGRLDQWLEKLAKQARASEYNASLAELAHEEQARRALEQEQFQGAGVRAFGTNQPRPA